MLDFILLMHDDTSAPAADTAAAWGTYLADLRARGAFAGGSSIGDGVCVRRAGNPPAVTRHLTGYIRVRAPSLEQARELVHGNPVFESGGTVEIRELPED